jgi:hypothetical protein
MADRYKRMDLFAVHSFAVCFSRAEKQCCQIHNNEKNRNIIQRDITGEGK